MDQHEPIPQFTEVNRRDLKVNLPGYNIVAVDQDMSAEPISITFESKGRLIRITGSVCNRIRIYTESHEEVHRT